MSGGGGLALLEGVRAVNPEIPVVVMTAFGTVASAVDAMKKGAADYLTSRSCSATSAAPSPAPTATSRRW